jgi:hypothetical protein
MGFQQPISQTACGRMVAHLCPHDGDSMQNVSKSFDETASIEASWGEAGGPKVTPSGAH